MEINLITVASELTQKWKTHEVTTNIVTQAKIDGLKEYIDLLTQMMQESRNDEARQRESSSASQQPIGDASTEEAGTEEVK